jgi:mono/diheme cytochrome c family protein
MVTKNKLSINFLTPYTQRKNWAWAVVVLLCSCNSVENSPGWEYMPDMYRSSSYDANSENPNFNDKMTNRMPVKGTISQGPVGNSEYSVLKMSYPYKNDSAGYEDAGKYLKNPLPDNAEIIAKGKERYEKFCQHCHGVSGAGDGPVVEKGNFPPPPAYSSPQLKNLPEGKIYHTIYYGKGMMGSHASQLTPEEIWQVIRYVQTLQSPGKITAAVDTTKK